jgi:hypothetical protein
MDTETAESPATMRDALRLAVSKLPKPVRLRAENAFAGFERAVALLPIDKEMASFRAITAEEEAASALFRALQLRNYPGSDQLNLGNHRHKAALGPFIQAVKVAMAAGRDMNLRMTLDWSQPSLEISIPLSEVGVVFEGAEDLQLTLSEPLGIMGRKGDGHPAQFFDKSIQVVADTAKSDTITKLIAKEANARNRLLYASDDAMPESKATAQSIEARRRRADIALFLCVAVLQTHNHQALAKQSLEAFLKVVGKPLPNPSLFEEPPVEVTIAVQAEGPSQVRFDKSA